MHAALGGLCCNGLSLSLFTSNPYRLILTNKVAHCSQAYCSPSSLRLCSLDLAQQAYKPAAALLWVADEGQTGQQPWHVP